MLRLNRKSRLCLTNQGLRIYACKLSIPEECMVLSIIELLINTHEQLRCNFISE